MWTCFEIVWMFIFRFLDPFWLVMLGFCWPLFLVWVVDVVVAFTLFVLLMCLVLLRTCWFALDYLDWIGPRD